MVIICDHFYYGQTHREAKPEKNKELESPATLLTLNVNKAFNTSSSSIFNWSEFSLHSFIHLVSRPNLSHLLGRIGFRNNWRIIPISIIPTQQFLPHTTWPMKGHCISSFYWQTSKNISDSILIAITYELCTIQTVDFVIVWIRLWQDCTFGKCQSNWPISDKISFLAMNEFFFLQSSQIVIITLITKLLI